MYFFSGVLNLIEWYFSPFPERKKENIVNTLCLFLKEDNLITVKTVGQKREITHYGKLILIFRDTKFVNIKPKVGSFL